MPRARHGRSGENENGTERSDDVNAPVLMVQGTTSWAGKSLVTTALCRWFARRGVDVVPFKAQNMSNNARIVDGGEIGAAQYLQALAAGVTPHVRMNPVLLKPETNTTSQVVVNGAVNLDLSRAEWRGRSETLWPVVVEALRELRAAHELVVVEGAGSPAEINLAASDIVNMRVAEAADAAVLLVTDIDRGGAFAHLYGTWALLEPHQRARIRGFVLNRFRGDAALLAPGPELLEARTGVPTIGVLPWLDHALPDEDGGGHRDRRPPPGAGRPAVAIVLYPTASNLDEYRMLEQGVDLVWARTPAHLRGADIVVLPGSKHVRGDLAWLRATGLADALHARLAAGGRVLGICGGLQMLGARIEDPDGVEGPPATLDGLGALPLVTTFSRDKRTAVTTAGFAAIDGAWGALSGCEVEGYEIRHGHTRAADPAVPTREVLAPGLGWMHGAAVGVVVHGVLENRSVLDRLFGPFPWRSLDQTFDELADALDAHLDMPFVAALVGQG
jgi:adenosylcobyric acid synthase